jgi:IPT/TIG domain
MRPRDDSFKLLPWVRIVLVAVLVLILSSWTTCGVFFSFNSCPGALPQPQITSLSPNTISVEAASVLLIVNGNNFVPQSQVLWNGSALATTFVDSHHLQVTITQATLESFGVSAGSNVLISAMSPSSIQVVGCPNGGASVRWYWLSIKHSLSVACLLLPRANSKHRARQVPPVRLTRRLGHRPRFLFALVCHSCQMQTRS